jgi:hypothetical protein
MKHRLKELLYELEDRKRSAIKSGLDAMNDNDEELTQFYTGENWALSYVVKELKNILNTSEKTEQSEVNNT